MTNPIDELIERLNRWASCSHGRVLAPSDLLETSSAALSTLQEQKRKLEEALREIVDETKYFEHPALRAAHRIATRALLSGGGDDPQSTGER